VITPVKPKAIHIGGWIEPELIPGHHICGDIRGLVPGIRPAFPAVQVSSLTILSKTTGTGRCSSSAWIPPSKAFHTSARVRRTGIALGWKGVTVAFGIRMREVWNSWVDRSRKPTTSRRLHCPPRRSSDDRPLSLSQHHRPTRQSLPPYPLP